MILCVSAPISCQFVLTLVAIEAGVAKESAKDKLRRQEALELPT